ncbi:MAG: helix-turn-helix transcriptional regulator [Clostridia bacterium]|nr:helix-turn-helix transcriptional regulator [Clostridia bacterium]
MFDSKRFSFKILSVLKLSWTKNKSYAKPRPFHALSFRVKGNAVFTHEKDLFNAKQHSLIYVPADYDYTLEANSDEEVIVVHFEILNDSEQFNRIETFNPSIPEIFLKLFEKLLSVWYRKPIGHQYKLDSLFLSVLEQAEIQSHDELSQKEKMLRSITDFIHANFSDPALTVDRLSETINVSSTYLRLLFKEYLGVSPHQYLTDVRLDHATALLRSGYCSVSKAAELSGYEDPKYFSVLYKRLRGKSPSDVCLE